VRRVSSLVPFLSRAYSLAVRSRLMELAWFRRIYAGAYFAYKRRLEDPFDGLVRRRPDLFRSGHILDVGAHIGYTSSIFFRVLGPGFRVYAFEPDPANVRMLRETVHRKGADGIIVPVQAAVGAEDGEVELWRNPLHPGDHRLATPWFRQWGGARIAETLRVSLVSLDGFLGREDPTTPVAFVKIDVQGYEPAVCQGMAKLLERCPRAVVALEYGPRELSAQGFDPPRLTEFFRSRGYLAHLLEKDGSFSTLPDDLDDLAEKGRGYLDLLMLPGGRT